MSKQADRSREPNPLEPEAPENHKMVKLSHHRIRFKGVNKMVYWLIRSVLEPAIRTFFRVQFEGLNNIPKGPVVFAPNHRSFLDPFIVALAIRRPLYFVAKSNFFTRKRVGWLLNQLGAFPVRRGHSDKEMFETADKVLERGDALCIFPEGTRVRKGQPAKPKNGAALIALKHGAPIVPVCIIGTEKARKGLMIFPVSCKAFFGSPVQTKNQENNFDNAIVLTEKVWKQVLSMWFTHSLKPSKNIRRLLTLAYWRKLFLYKPFLGKKRFPQWFYKKLFFKKK